MKKVIVVAAMLMFVSGAWAQDGGSDEIGMTFEVKYLSQWISKGMRAYGKQGAVFETLDLDLFDSGLHAYAVHRSATASGYVDKERFDYGLYYLDSMFDGMMYKTDYKLEWHHEHYTDIDRHKANTTQEASLHLSWPDLCPSGIVPRYATVYETPVFGGRSNRNGAGWVHLFGLGYDLEVAELPNPLNLGWDIVYNDGLGSGMPHDWAYSTLSAKTKMAVAENLSLIPAVYYQITMDKATADDDILYSTVSMKYDF